MRLYLSTRERARLAAAMRLLLAPLEHASVDDWRSAVLRSVRALVGADRAVFLLPGAGGSPLYSHEYPEPLLRQYVEHYYAIDVGRLRREALALEVWSRERLHAANPRELAESAIYRELFVPNRIFDTMGLTIAAGAPGTEATIFLHQERAGTPAFGERGLALLSLLLPAFRAGVASYARLRYQREELVRLLDRIADAMRIYDAAGRLVHQNSAFAGLVAAEPERDRLLAAADRVAFGMRQLQPSWLPRELGALAGAPLADEAQTATAQYRLVGSFIGAELLGAEALIGVSVERWAPAPSLPDAELRARFGFTQREVEVAQLLARGESTTVIAGVLGISPHTTRRHTERIFAKLGVHSRAAVGAVLRGEVPAPE